MKYFLIALVLNICTENAKSSFCYWNTGCHYKYFSSKTPYNAIRGDIRDSLVKIKDCEPIFIWGLYRHGKKNPGAENGSKMKDAVIVRDFVSKSYDKGKSSLCAQDVDNLRNWIYDEKLFSQTYGLADEGIKEIRGISERLKQAFPKLLNSLDNKNFVIRSTFEPWIDESARLFIKGLGNERLQFEKYTNSEDNDITAPYSSCGNYQKNWKQNPDNYNEISKYLKTSDYLAAKDRIQRRLGIEYNLTNDNITALYNLCRYTWTSIGNKISPWCALFTTDDLQVLEYIGDLKHYYDSGYGCPMSAKFGGYTLSDLLQKFKEAKAFEERKLVAYFTHSSMLDMVYTALDIFKDEIPLVGANRSKERRWRNSVISAFAANLVAVLNRCTGENPHDYNVVFYLNEEPLRSICQGGICSWQEFEDKMTPFVNTTLDFCDFKTDPY